jgi:acetyl esterase
MTLDPNVQKMLETMRSLGLPPIHQLDPEQARERVRQMRAARGPQPPEPGTREDLSLNGVPARSHRPASGEARGTVVYYHGGGWVLGELDTTDPVAGRLANTSGAEVISVDYRLAPEHPFPAPVEDAWTALEWVGEHRDGPIAVIGDSAGGNLAAVTALQARDRGGPAIAHQVLVYPVTDYDVDAYPSHAENGGGDYGLGTADMEWFFDHYVPDPAQRHDPLVSPIRASDLSGLPPALVIVAGYDPLRDEGIAYAEKLKAAGVEVELETYAGMNHGFFGMLGLLPTSDEAVAAVGERLGRALGARTAVG